MIELSKNITEYILNHFGKEYLNSYLSYVESEYKPYLRVASDVEEEKLIKSLCNYGIKLEKVENVPGAYQITEGGNFAGKTLDFILGKYYLQSLSSMIPPLVLNPNENDIVLDLCAAPGSKTTQLADLMNKKGTLIANEVSMERLKSLVFNIDKMNLANVGVLHGKGELLSKMYENYFDKILVDAPCSALGITQKKGEVSNWWNENKLVTFSELQTKLLVAAVKMCKVGGEIVFSTCTLSMEENEFVLKKILDNYPVELIAIQLPVKSRNAFTEIDGKEIHPSISCAKRIVPWEINSEGFFVSKLKKIDFTERVKDGISYSDKTQFVTFQNSKIKNQVFELADYFGIEKNLFGNYKYLMRSKDIYFAEVNWNSHGLDSFIRIGSKLGSIEKRGYIQLHTLAAQILGKHITKNIIDLSELSEIEIYLKGGTIKKDYGSTGQKIIKFRGDIIGTAVASKDGLKSQFPREYRTQEIIVK